MAKQVEKANEGTYAAKKGELAVAVGPVARRLEETNVLGRLRVRKGIESPRVLDPRRVNVVSSQLCGKPGPRSGLGNALTRRRTESIIEYLGPSLERHRGCDLVDLNPGAGVWSSTLHEFLQPRKHVLMDLDAELYRPFLDPLLRGDKVKLIAKSGIVWKDLLDMMRTQLPEQIERDKEVTPTRNDTLLVTANLSMFPKHSFQGFDSISTMVLYQFLSSIRTSSLFQKYGLVRMLVWVNNEDKIKVIPRTVVGRRRNAFEAEISCEWIHEVAGLDLPEHRCNLRDWWINAESGYRTMERMAAAGLEMPSTMMPKDMKERRRNPKLMGQPLAGVHPPSLERPFKEELERLEWAREGDESKEEDSVRLKNLRIREKLAQTEALRHHELLQQYKDIIRLAASSPSEFEAANAQWNERVGGLIKNARREFSTIRDNYHIFRQDPPVLLWDRRAYEPLCASATDFFPNVATALLDMQPKAMRPVLRQYGPGTSRSGDMSDLMLRFWFQQLLSSVPKAMEGLWGGFGDLAARCPSLTDPGRGGSPLTGHGAVVSRAVNEAQWAEVVQAWMDWPFRPSYVQMLARMMDDFDAEPDEDDFKSGAAGNSY